MQDIFKKVALFYEGTQKFQKIMNTASLSARTLICPGLVGNSIKRNQTCILHYEYITCRPFTSSKNTDFENKAKFTFCTYPQFEKEARGKLGMAFLVHSFSFLLTMLAYSQKYYRIIFDLESPLIQYL